MTIIYRTTGAWGAGLGSNLSPAQVDNNFWEVVGRIVDLESGAVATVNQIQSITLTGTQLSITMEDYSVFGPFTVPTATFHWTGEWAPSVPYFELDLFFESGSGTYIVLLDHTSDLTFDPDFLVGGEPAYKLIMPDNMAFLSLTDVPNSYVGMADRILTVNEAEDAVVFSLPEHSVKFFYKGIPGASELMWRERVDSNVLIFINDWLFGGYAADTCTAASVQVEVWVNGVLWGAITFNNDDTVGVPGVDLALTVGDLLEFYFQSTIDDTFANVGIQIVGHRTGILSTS